MNWRITTAPAIEPVLLAEAKQHLRIEHALEDDIITSWITAAREWCENYQQRAYITQTLTLTMDDFPAGDIIVPRPPLQTVTSIMYDDVDNTNTEFVAANYLTDTSSDQFGRIALALNVSWPSVYGQAGDVVVTCQVGYGATGAFVPSAVRSAIKLLVGHFYEHREAVSEGSAMTEVPMAVKSLLSPQRVLWYPE